MGRRMTLLVLVLALVAGACGDDPASSTPTTIEPATSTSGAAAFPVTVRGTEIPQLPQRIVSLSATHTEILYAIGAGPAVVGTDLFSDYPAAAADTEKIDAFNLSVEAVAALDPDLVVLSFDPGDAVSGFAALGIPAILFAPPGPEAIGYVYDEWQELGVAAGHLEEAQALVRRVRDDIEATLEMIPPTAEPFTFFVELDSTLFSAGPGTLLDSVFGMLGLQNIVGTDAGSYPQLSVEALLDADPDFIFLADTVCCGQSAASVAQRPGWDELSAVQNGNVVELDDSVASRWGPRILELILTIANEVHGI